MGNLWLPEFNAFEAILNRAEADQHAARLREFNQALASLVDYGTNLIPRALSTSERKLKDIVVLAVLLKQVVAMLDASVELLQKACVEPAFLQMRAAFEASVYLEWILQGKQSTRARVFNVWNVRRNLRWIRRATKRTREFTAMQRDMRGLSIQSTLLDPAKQRELRKEERRFQAMLLEPHSIAWHRRFERRKGKRLHDIDWYKILFKKRASLATLAKAVRRTAEYRIYYELGSEVMHGSRKESHIRVPTAGELHLRSLRELTEYPFIFQALMGIGLYTYRVVLEHYRPDEAGAFARKYVDTWRKTFQSRLNIEYNRLPRSLAQ